ncbi:DUF4251 domain-containing protein [Sunxiuqinia elliptica]|uniref:Uncharacterized protein DUF4251 n=1 Tax=Sunxiuqinia elliptica TaxID=655355 RepID=A0A4R6H9U4_9BACT|nr:DUF4251 domain-containing protein [Sunxiuqinia elliptica]TDO04668.1 uncharacterized protein DUF4251 [Sunxiuqinia elliptica]TDO64216.1 uncharacterized protein DUF4251 [Sunxiuqinia elliptica]
MKQFTLFMLMIMLSLGMGYAQDKTESTIQEMIEGKQFKFTARSVTPLSGSTINLTSTYDLVVDSSLVEAWLPFYGRAYQSDYGSTEGGIKFKEEAKLYEVKYNEKKKSYAVRIEVDTAKDSYKIYISAGESGYASMSISSNRKQSVSYYGIIEALDE